MTVPLEISIFQTLAQFARCIVTTLNRALQTDRARSCRSSSPSAEAQSC
jgi:hypothetical protein